MKWAAKIIVVFLILAFCFPNYVYANGYNQVAKKGLMRILGRISKIIRSPAVTVITLVGPYVYQYIKDNCDSYDYANKKKIKCRVGDEVYIIEVKKYQ